MFQLWFFDLFRICRKIEYDRTGDSHYWTFRWLNYETKNILSEITLEQSWGG